MDACQIRVKSFLKAEPALGLRSSQADFYSSVIFINLYKFSS